jgi:hypothetical protein
LLCVGWVYPQILFVSRDRMILKFSVPSNPMKLHTRGILLEKRYKFLTYRKNRFHYKSLSNYHVVQNRKEFYFSLVSLKYTKGIYIKTVTYIVLNKKRIFVEDVCSMKWNGIISQGESFRQSDPTMILSKTNEILWRSGLRADIPNSRVGFNRILVSESDWIPSYNLTSLYHCVKMLIRNYSNNKIGFAHRIRNPDSHWILSADRIHSPGSSHEEPWSFVFRLAAFLSIVFFCIFRTNLYTAH